ncbi:MAG: lactate utilization protein [Lachnospiraceae bacterium]|nr:lactate utilization protein [Lachnospiraceae bacterium]
MDPKHTYYEHRAETVIKNLKKRNMEGFYCATAAEACEKAMSLIRSGESVSFGGSMTIEECGILDALRRRDDIVLYDRATAKNAEELGAIFRQAFSADTYLMSTNALTLDGELINIDGNGNRVAALMFGPKQVIIVAGMNKIVSTQEEGIRRARNMAAPPNCVRLAKNTPCATTGRCHDCCGPETICNHTVVTRHCRDNGRINVILVGEELGY